jgi:prepilin peptidase CpaA
MTTQVVVITAGVVASIVDLRARRVPNLLTMPLAIVGMWMAIAGVGNVTPGAALLGGAVGLAVMLPLHVMGGMGAGDVKLVAACGTLLGPVGTLNAILRMGIAGGIIALLVAMRRGRLRHTLRSTALVVVGADGAAAAIESPEVNNRFPYAPAIAIGAALVTLGW